MKHFLRITFFVLIFYFGLYGLSHAQTFDIWKGTGGGGETCNVKGPCTLCDAVIVVSNIVTYLFEVAIPISVLMIVIGAVRLMIAGGSEERVASGKRTITSAVTGLIIALAAWLIINTVLHILTGRPDFPWSSFNCVGNPLSS